MTWGKVDDKLHSHPKPESAGLEAMGLWTLALSYCADLLTDGHVSRERAARLAGDVATAERLADRLCGAGLWHPADAECDDPACSEARREGSGWRFHEWSRYQPTRAKVLAERKAKQEAGKRGGTRKAERVAETKAAAVAPASPVLAETPLLPIPIPIPIPDHTHSGARARGVTGIELPDRPPNPDRAPPDHATILAALRAQRALEAVATDAMAEQILGDAVMGGYSATAVLAGVADVGRHAGAEAAAGAPRDVAALARMVSSYVANAAKHARSMPRPAPGLRAAPEERPNPATQYLTPEQHAERMRASGSPSPRRRSIPEDQAPRHGPAVAQNGGKNAPTPPGMTPRTPGAFSGPSRPGNDPSPQEAAS